MKRKQIDPGEATILKCVVQCALSLLLMIGSFAPRPAWAAAPAMPTNLTTTMASSRQINLAWQDKATTETNYYVERSPNGSSSWTVVGTLGANIVSYQNTGLSQNTTYYYRVRCKAGTTYSSYSNTANAKTAILTAPAALTATVASASQISLAWTDNTAYETQYSLERSPNGSSSWAVTATVASNVTTTTNSGLSAGTAYYYRVRAYDSTNYSAYSTVVNRTIRTITTSAGANGTITPSGTIGAANGAAQAFTITPNSGYKIAGVTVDGASVATDPTYTFSNITANHTIAASFSVDTTYTIAASAGANGSISPSGSVLVSGGTGTTFTITPNTGYSLTSLLVDGATITATSPYVFNNITANHTINATFSDKTPPTGSITINNNAAYTNNPSVALALYATDSGSGVSQMQFSNDNVTWTVAEAFVNIKSWPLAPGDGPKIFYVKYKDIAENWSYPFSSTIILDTEAPAVAISAPVSGLTGVATPLLTYTVSDGTVIVKVDGNIVSKVSGSNLDPLSDGVHTVRVEATDAAGNRGSADVTFTVEVDTVSPTTALSTNPSSPDGANGWFKTVPTITLTSNESGTTYYQWVPHLGGVSSYDFTRPAREWINGGEHLNILGVDVGAWYTLPFSFTFYGKSYSQVFLSTNGLLSFEAEDIEYDNSLGLANRVAIAPLWDSLATDWRTDDDIYVFQPDADSIGFRWQAVTTYYAEDTNFEVILYRDGRIRFNYGAQNGDICATIGISRGDGATYHLAYERNIFNTNDMDSIVYMPHRPWFVYDQPLNAPSGGSNLNYYSVDSSGNVEATQSRSFNVDTTAPIVNITSPLTGFSNNTMPLLMYTLNKLPSAETVTVDGVMVGKLSGDTLGSLAEGPHTIRVAVTDYVGNTAFDEVIFTVVSFAQSVSITSPAAGATNNSSPLLSYLVNYGAVTVKVDGAVVSTTSGGNLDALTDGLHTLRVESADAAGSMVSAEVDFTVDTVPPYGTILTRFSKIEAGAQQATATALNGTLWAWGYGPLGDGTTIARLAPTRIGGTDWTAVSAGDSHTVALKSDGSLWAWGSSSDGRLGAGTGMDPDVPITVPIRVGADTNWTVVSAGGSHTAALKSDGSLWTWGNNDIGQLGTGAFEVDQNVPTQAGPPGFIAVSAGYVHTVALRSDHTIWATGSDYNGQLGWTMTCYPYAQNGFSQMGSDTDWAAISVGDQHTVALKTDGTLWAWGDGIFAPTKIGSGRNWTAIAASSGFTMALNSDGEIWGWGNNAHGQLGDGTAIYREAPVQVVNETGFVAVSAAAVAIYPSGTGGYTLALKSDGTLWTWGYNSVGQLGDGTRLSHSTPQQVVDYLGSRDPITINNGAVSTNSASVTLTLSAWDVTTETAFMKFSNDGAMWSTPESYATTTTWTLSPGNGLKTVSVMYQDAAGNWSSVYSVSITLYTVNPVVTIVSPVAGVLNSNNPILTYTASEGTVVVKVDGNVVTKVSGNALDALSNGSHTVRVEVTDASNNIGYAEVTFTIESGTPVVIITSPVAGVTKNKTPTLMYTASDGTVVVKIDGATVNKVSGNTLDALGDGSHTVRVEATNASGTSFAEVNFTVDTVAPSVTISSPIAGTTNDDTPPLIYTVSQGVVTVKVDGYTVSKVSGNTLDPLSNGSHTVRVEARDAANNTGYAEVAFIVNTAAAGNDDTNIYCSGTGTYLVGYSSFTSDISVPTANNDVWISSPGNNSTINGTKVIIKGAMDTTIPVSAVNVLVTSSTGSASYLVQVNGKYFAAQIPITTGDNTITVTATDQNSGTHTATVIVTGTGQTENVTLTASPNTGIPTLKESGETLLDVTLMTSISVTTTVANYTWDFSGTGSSDLTCYSHSNVNLDYEHVGLYLTQVTLADTAGHTYKDTAIVNVLDKETMNDAFTQKWNSMKSALASGDITGALTYYVNGAREVFNQRFSEPDLSTSLPEIVAAMGSFRLVNMTESTAECELRIDRDGEAYSFQVLFIRDSDGRWGILSY